MEEEMSIQNEPVARYFNQYGSMVFDSEFNELSDELRKIIMEFTKINTTGCTIMELKVLGDCLACDVRACFSHKILERQIENKKKRDKERNDRRTNTGI